MTDKVDFAQLRDKQAEDAACILLILYGAYVLGLLMQFIIYTIIPGSLAVLAALIVAYARRRTAAGSIFESHYTWLIRTFWIGGAVFLPVMTLLHTGYVVINMDMSAFDRAINEGNNSMPEIMANMLADNKRLLIISALWVFTPFCLWWFYRCGNGIRHLYKRNPVPNPTRWF